MKFIYNKTIDCYTKIDDLVQIYVGEGQKGLTNPFAIIVHLKDKTVAPLVFFKDKEEAGECLLRIIEFYRGSEIEGEDVSLDRDILTVTNNVPDSILVTPDSIKNKTEFKRVK